LKPAHPRPPPADRRRRRPHPRPAQGIPGPRRLPGDRRRPAGAAARKADRNAGFRTWAVFDVMMPGEDGFFAHPVAARAARAGGPDAGPDAHRHGRSGRPDRGPEARRRRLSGQAVRAGRSSFLRHRGDPAPWRWIARSWPDRWRLGRCRFDPDRGELACDGEPVKPHRGGGHAPAPGSRGRRHEPVERLELRPATRSIPPAAARGCAGHPASA